MKKNTLLIVLIFFILSSSNFSQTYYSSTNTNLAGRSSVYIQGGTKLNSGSSANVSAASVETDMQFIGFVGYQYWFNNEWSLNGFGGMFNAASKVSAANVSSISVYPAMFGASYYPESLIIGDIGRVYFSASLGVYNGTGTKTSFSFSNLGAEVINESVFGAAVGAGIDLFPLDWLRVGPSLSYHFVSEFSQVVGDRRDYSGPVFGFTAGILF